MKTFLLSAHIKYGQKVKGFTPVVVLAVEYF